MRLKVCDSYLISKVVNKYLKVREWVEVVERNKRWSPLFPCCPVSRQCLWQKILIERKSIVAVPQSSFIMLELKHDQNISSSICFSNICNYYLIKLIKFITLIKLMATRNATRCNNRDDLLHLSFPLKILIFSEAYIKPSRTSMMELLLRKY